ncbi:MAG: yunB [Oscillospiraceae bacterium]|jgi:sporulation protein YunB|nr:yunB [Oscillospiraceae bacterium]
MFRRFWPRRTLQSQALKIRFLVFMLIVFGLLALIDAQIRPMIKSMAAYQAKVYATRVINEAIGAQLTGNTVSYDSLVKVTTDNNGRVTSVQTDMVRLNLLKATMTDAASQQLALLQSQTIRIPLGTLLGWQLLSGRGPKIEFKIVPAGFVQSQLNHRFDSAGINQTRHQIVMQLDANIIAILPGYTAASEISSSLILAETVIVGVSPESFTQVLTKNDDAAGLIADYKK